MIPLRLRVGLNGCVEQGHWIGSTVIAVLGASVTPVREYSPASPLRGMRHKRAPTSRMLKADGLAPLGLNGRHLSHWEQAVGQRSHRSDVVKQHAGHNPKAHGKHAGHANHIWHHDHVPTPLHVCPQIAGDVSQFAEMRQAFIEKYNMSRVCGDRRSTPQRNRDIGFFEGDRVVDPVPHKAHFLPLGLQFCNIVGLFGGQHLGKVAIHTKFLGQSLGWRLVIARDNRQMLDPSLA